MVADVDGAEQIRAIVTEFAEVFGPLPIGGASVQPMSIVLIEGQVPRSVTPRRLAPALQEVMEGEVERWMQQGIIQPSSASISFPVVMVRKKDKTYRPCIDFRELNRCTLDLKYPIESTRAVLSRLAGNRVFGTLDLLSGFHQIPLSVDSRALTAFAVAGGLYEFCQMPFGLKCAPAFFQKTMKDSLGALVGRICEVFVDDIMVYGRDVAEFCRNLRDVLKRLKELRLRVKGSKCELGLRKVVYLGHEVSEQGIELSQSRKQGLQSVKAPSNLSQLRSFIGMATYFRPFIANFAVVAKPLHSMCSPKKVFRWSDEAQKAFEDIKAAILAAPLLHFIDYGLPIIVRTDASQLGVGGMLLQVVDGVEQVAGYVSRAFTEQEGRWSTVEQEAYAVVYAITSFESYIRGHAFIVQTDHRNLMFLYKARAPKVVRWRLGLQEFDFTVEHIPGADNCVADAMSRCFPAVDLPHAEEIMVVHNPLVGHRGVDRTIELLVETGHSWDGMQADVEQFIQSCATCQKVRLGQGSVVAALKTTAVREPFSVVAVDTMGPFPADAYGNCYVVVMIDCFTRFVELKATKDCTALEAATSLLDIFGRYGMPKAVRSDEGPQFTARVVDNFLHLLGVSRDFTIPYRPESNGIVERVNQEIGRHLRSLIMDQRSSETWSISLPMVQRIVNATPHRSIGVAPVRLMFGDAVTADRFMLKVPDAEDEEDDDVSSYEDYVQQLIRAQKELVKRAQAVQDAAIAKYLADAPENPTEFSVGDLVLVSYPERPPNKLRPKWQGPQAIVARDGVRYDVQDLLTQGIRSVHVSRLKLFRDEQTTDPRTVAAVDTGEYLVDHVVEHRAGAGGTMLFRVRWLGYPPSEDTWMPPERIRDLAQFRAYKLLHPEIGL